MNKILIAIPTYRDNKKIEKLFNEIQVWNKQAEEEKTNWDTAIRNWKAMTLPALGTTKTNDIVGRYLMMISGTVKKVTDNLFLDRKAILQEESESDKKPKGNRGSYQHQDE